VAFQVPRAVEPQGLDAAAWIRSHLGPNNRVGSDDVNNLILGAYGDQWVSTNLNGGADANWVLYSRDIGRSQLDLLRRARIQYIVVDRRIVQAPNIGRKYYLDVPISVALAKFDHTRGISRVYDNGNIAIFDVRHLSGAR
jgi:hypothetical protein